MRRLTSKSEAGLTLVELLIGVLLGTIVAAGALSVYVMSIQGQTDNIQLARLNQDMRAMMDIMVRDIRRAGFVTDNPEPEADGGYLSSLKNNPFFAATNDLAIYNNGSCIVYSYNRNHPYEKTQAPPDNIIKVDNDERLGFRLSSGNLQMRLSGNTNASCNAEGDSWQSITEPEVEITALKFTLTSSTLNVSSMATDDDEDGFFNGDNNKNGLCDSGEDCTKCVRDGSPDPACLTIRTVTIALSGRLRDDHDVVQTINSQVRVRNDKYFPPVP